MVPPNTPEVPREQPTPALNTPAQLEQLKEHIVQGRLDAAVDTIMQFAIEGDDMLNAAAETFVQGLSAQELQTVIDFLSGTEDPKKTQLHSELLALQTEMDGNAPPETGTQTPVQRILGAIDKGIERVGLTGKLNELAAKFGFKGEVGEKQVTFLKNIFVGFAARTVEGMVLAIKRINPAMDIAPMMNTSLELRLFGISDAVQREKYKDAYLAWAKNPTTPNPPTLQEVMNPAATPTETKVAEATPTAEAAPEAPVTVESSSIVSFQDGTPNLEITKSENVFTLTTDEKKATMTVENLQSVAVRAPAGTDVGIVEIKLADGSTVSVTPADLRNAVREKKSELLASNNTTKISLADVPTV